MLTKEDLKKIEELLQPKFDQIFNSLIDIDRRIENLVEVVATHTDMLKDINLRVIAIERHMKSNMQYAQNLDSEIGLHEERLHKLEEISGILNTLRDKGKDRCKCIKPLK